MVEGARLESDPGDAHRVILKHSWRSRLNDLPPQDASRCDSVNLGIRCRSGARLTQFLHSFSFQLRDVSPGVRRRRRCSPANDRRLHLGLGEVNRRSDYPLANRLTEKIPNVEANHRVIVRGGTASSGVRNSRLAKLPSLSGIPQGVDWINPEGASGWLDAGE